ncbi:hypothetical protein ID866_8571 [Astraeus odoratus]|nr:hypothetical protein ID866_8571 [Astraeus odoratus]
MRRDGDAAHFDSVQRTWSLRVWDAHASQLRHGIHCGLDFWKTRPRRVNIAEQTPASNLHPHPSCPFQASSWSPSYARPLLSCPMLLR